MPSQYFKARLQAWVISWKYLSFLVFIFLMNTFLLIWFATQISAHDESPLWFVILECVSVGLLTLEIIISKDFLSFFLQIGFVVMFLWRTKGSGFVTLGIFSTEEKFLSMGCCNFFVAEPARKKLK